MRSTHWNVGSLLVYITKDGLVCGRYRVYIIEGCVWSVISSQNHLALECAVLNDITTSLSRVGSHLLIPGQLFFSLHILDVLTPPLITDSVY